MADDFKYHIDHHASLVPPPALVDALRRHAAGELDDADLAAAVDEAVADSFVRQRRLGLLALSDGEHGRGHDLAVVYDGVDGFGEPSDPSPLAQLVGPAHAPEVRPLTAVPTASGRIAAAEGARLGALTERSTMIALPSPGYVAALCASEDLQTDAGASLAAIIGGEVRALAADGVTLVLLRNPALAFLLTVGGRERAAALGIDLDKAVAAMVEADAAAIADLGAVPEEFRVGLDLTSAGAATGPWDVAAVEAFLGAQPYDRICVDYPAAAEQRFPLEVVPDGLVVSLGVVDVSDPALEDVDDLVARIDEAAELLDIDDIAVATNGGFHAVPGTPRETEHDKLELVEMTARYFWGNEL
ncbi:5-methyltetrahydropteroyltriglutamate--homocysteine methyltransferase [Mumia flava]|uniref:5-methyltetrahydropteroyltriglutamate--homocysteine methyltransferase n=1 Tax=Mumia flava TaxID=1348852 RepID=A0A0B2BFC2_9ACTN|nr:methionine synthase [Mumia flava]PJJ48239.1 5-methyltetrahydropteroyltriglutamate--homocysteine methyltransferase [Mumia flava]